MKLVKIRLTLTLAGLEHEVGGGRGVYALEAAEGVDPPPPSGLAGVTAIRDYRKKNPNTWTQDGLDYFANDMGKSVSNFLYDLACASWVLGTSATGIGLVINAAIILL